MSDSANIRYRILSIDGGPAAPVQVRMLRKLEEAYPGFLASTHQFGGTSDGALVALFLASRLPADNEAAKRISLDVLDDAIAFSNSTIRALQPTTYSMLRFLSGMGALIDPEPFRRVLVAAFGDMKLSEIERDCHVSCYSIDMLRGSLAMKLGTYCPSSWTIVDALMATSALPMYMPPHKIDMHQYVDGALKSNDCSFDAVVATLHYCRTMVKALKRMSRSALPQNSPALEAMLARATATTFEERAVGIRVLSLGLEPPPQNRSMYSSETFLKHCLGDRSAYFDHNADWGWLQWLLNRPRLLPAMLYSSTNDNMTTLRSELFEPTPDRCTYFRFAPDDEVIGEVVRVATRNAQALLDNADGMANTLWRQGLARKPDDPPNNVSTWIEFVKDEWLESSADKPGTNPCSALDI